MKKRTVKEISLLLNYSLASSSFVEGFAIDSRQVQKGEVFFALEGAKEDGHCFLKQVAQQGAIGAIVSNKYQGEDFGLQLIRVENVQEALHLLAKEAFKKRKEKVVGITGSMGKTTTKEFLATLLQVRYKVGKTEGNHNTKLTLPLTILNFKEKYDLLVLEMGMNLAGEIAKLVDIAPLDYALITRIAPAGIGAFPDGLEGIAAAKGEIFSHPRTILRIVSSQVAGFKQALQGSAPLAIYGSEEGCDFILEEKEGLFRIKNKESYSPFFALQIKAKHLQENFLAAATMASLLGVSWEEIAQQAPFLAPYERRFEAITRFGVTFIQDCYNANPDSVRAAFENLPTPQKGRKVIGVLGTMPDLGCFSEEYHQEIGYAALKYLDQLLCIGKEMEPVAELFKRNGKQASYFCDKNPLKEELFCLIKEGDVVLIKGSNRLSLWELLE